MIPDIRFEKNNPNCLVFHNDRADSIISDDTEVNDRCRGPRGQSFVQEGTIEKEYRLASLR